MINNKKRNVLLVFLVIASSGIPFFSGINVIEIFMFAYTGLLILINKVRVDSKALLIVFLFVLIEFFQHALHGSYSYFTSIGTLIKLLSAYFIVKLVQLKFIDYYLKILYFFTKISLIFYSLSFIPGFTEFMINNICPFFESPFVDPDSFYKPSPHILIFTFEGSLISEFRNSGPFWEPGAFGVYLILALLFNIIRNGRLFKDNKLFLIALITTFSTAGYIAFFVLVSGFFFFKGKFSYKIILVFFVMTSFSIYTSTSFLEEKVEQNISLADETTSSRFGSALADFNLFKQSPFVGWGRGPKRYGPKKVVVFGQAQHRNNGIFILLATYGLIGSILYFVFFYSSLSSINKFYGFKKGFTLSCFITIMLLGFSQSLFFKPFFLCLLFLFLTYNSKFKSLKMSKKHA